MLCDVCDVNKSYEKQHLSSRLTAAAVIVHQYDLFKEVAGGFVYGRLDGAQDDGQRLVHEDEHDADLRQVRGVRRVLAPARRERRAFKQKNHRVSLPPGVQRAGKKHIARDVRPGRSEPECERLSRTSLKKRRAVITGGRIALFASELAPHVYGLSKQRHASAPRKRARVRTLSPFSDFLV